VTDPCDNLSDELVEVLLFDVRYAKLSPRERRASEVNSHYGKMAHILKGHCDYGRLMAASWQRLFASYAVLGIPVLRMSSDGVEYVIPTPLPHCRCTTR
jgi:hypothetical protein